VIKISDETQKKSESDLGIAYELVTLILTWSVTWSVTFFPVNDVVENDFVKFQSEQEIQNDFHDFQSYTLFQSVSF
jgi:hypothetical protein